MDPLGRIPPYNQEAEAAVLGTILLNNQALSLVQPLLSVDAFYVPAHRVIFAAMLGLAATAKPIDHVTLGNALMQHGDLEKIGGSLALDGLTRMVVTVAHAEHYARIVQQKALVREMISAAQRVVVEGFAEDLDPDAYLDQAERSIFAVAKDRLQGSYLPVSQVLSQTFDHLEAASQRTGDITGITTGFVDLDGITAGLHTTDLIIIAGRPGMGKTSLAMNMAFAATRSTQKPALVFSLEMGNQDLVKRLLASEGRVHASKLRSPNRLQPSDWKALTDAASGIHGVPLYLDDTAPMRLMDIRSKVRRLQAEHGLCLVVIDYLQLMSSGPQRKESREQEIAEISRSLKNLAKEVSVPIIALSQLNRGVEGRSNKRPLMSDLRESGAIEQDADLILFIYRDVVYDENTIDPHVAEIIVAKQRSGPVGMIKLRFDAEYTRFDNLVQQDDRNSISF